MRDLSNIKNLIIKIGSSSLCDDEGNINKEKILNLIQQIAYIKRKGISITLVSSGAINAGVHVMILNVARKLFLKSKLWQLLDRLH